ncbi:hypothetical protein HYU17_00615 [Candidatus Woesearchaeota archaeon]|nr:hypothetical protein [Candidatus Woesearchaeota archaeon]
MPGSPVGKKEKKGLAQGEVVSAVAAVAVFFLVFSMTKPYIAAAQTKDLIEGCKLSVALASFQFTKDFWVMDYTFMDSPFQFNCKTIFSEITKKSIKRYDDKIRLSTDTGERENQLKELIMKNMKDCWYMFGEGKIKLQQSVDAKDGTACIVCSEIIPSQDFVDEGDAVELTNLYSYAAATAIPPKDEKTYMEYFLENSVHKPQDFTRYISAFDGKAIKFYADKTGKRVPQPYSVVFALSTQSQNRYFFGKYSTGSTAPPNAGIVDCYLGGYDKNPVTGGDAADIGCNTGYGKPVPGYREGENPGLVFGKVVDGGNEVDLTNWKVELGKTGTLKVFPATVRLVPSSELASTCKRLY